MKTSILITMTILSALLAGCENKHKEGDGHAQAEGEAHTEETVGITFSEKSGLKVSSETAKFIGLKTAEVEERQVKAELRFTAQVYRAAGEARFAAVAPMVSTTALASGRMSTAEAALLREGQSVSVTAEGVGPLTAHVTTLERSLEKLSGQVEVLLSIADPYGRLSGGAFVSATVPLGGEKTVASVPRAALLRTTDGDFVYTASGESFTRAAVKLGAVNGEFAEITDGLYAGDQVVVHPAMTLWLAEIQALRGGKACSDGH
jgi:hypothetical protein